MSSTKSVRLLEELEAPVEAMPRGAFSFVANRLLQLYFTDEKVREAVGTLNFAPKPEVPVKREAPKPPSTEPIPAIPGAEVVEETHDAVEIPPAKAQKLREQAEIAAATDGAAKFDEAIQSKPKPDLVDIEKADVNQKPSPVDESPAAPVAAPPAPEEPKLPPPVEKPVEKLKADEKPSYSLLDSILPS